MDAEFDVAVLGSANLDIVVRTERHPVPGETVLGSAYAEYPGGKGLNQAISAARSGASTCLVGAVGSDAAGNILSAAAHGSGVDVSTLRTVDAPTGRAVITVDDAGENSIVVTPGANAHVLAELPPSRVALAQLEVPVDTVVAALRAARATGARTMLNPAPAQPLPRELVRCVDVIVPNEHELDLLGGRADLLAGGVGTVIVTRGGSGIEVTHLDRSGAISTTTLPAFRVEVVDTTGAGDAFCGALAARWAEGTTNRPDTEALRWASAAGALATTLHGAVPSLPDRDAIRTLLDRRE